ncbi:MAG: PQQ-dependent sugar dehydrogenase [Reichenbachiella sp.]
MRGLVIGIISMCIGLYSCTNIKYDENSSPDEFRFSQEVFLTNLNEPVELEVLPNGNVLFVQRKGGIKLYDPENMRMVLEDSLPVFYGFEDGLMGMALDPNFSKNNWIYLYYSPVGDEPKQHLSRFVLTSEGIADEKLMLIVPTQRDECCHTGGSIEFNTAEGLLYLSTGDDTNPFKSNGYGPIDDREGLAPFDARRTSSNTNDLRGKILRIKPEDDGTYSIPKGNLFVDDDPKTRPEIYVMGCRNPYRITVDQKRGWLYWGDVGPDAGDNHEKRGPRGYDEMNMANKPGYYGWPLFIGDNKAYGDYDFETKEITGFFDPEHPINDSKNNTGIQELPPATPAMIYYPYSNSSEFPQLTNGGRTAMTGPVFYSEPGQNKSIGFPSYFDGRLFIYDWMRDWIFTILVDEKGVASDFQPFTPSMDFNNIIDIDFGSDGSLYMIEYGSAWFKQNQDAQLSRLNFNRGNRVPVMNVEVSKTAGSSPLTVTLDASNSIDHDNDELSYSWKIGDEIFTSASITYTFEENGIHRPRLTLEDGAGHTLIKQFKVEVGNDPPLVDIIIEGNQTFYWPNREIKYDVKVNDNQDGSLRNGIAREAVNFDIAYLDGLDQAQLLGHQMPISSGEAMIGKSDCMSCHKVNGKSVGPSFMEVANRYRNDKNAMDHLSTKIVKGGSGAWGDHSMSAHPDFTMEETNSMVEYILSLTEVEEELKPLSGSHIAQVEDDKKILVFSAQYTDQGAKGMSSISSIKNIQLKSNSLNPGRVSDQHNVGIKQGWLINKTQNGSWVMYENIDLNGIESIDVNIRKRNDQKVTISFRVGKPDGTEIGSVEILESTEKYAIATVVLDNFNEQHDLYLVFEGDIQANNLVQVQNIQFQPVK